MKTLEQAAEEYALKIFPKEEGKAFHSYFGTIEFDKNASMRTGAITGFIAGAKWMAEQGSNYVTTIKEGGSLPIDARKGYPSGFKAGDKVIVQIRKAE